MENKELIQVGRSTVGRRGKDGAIIGIPGNILDGEQKLTFGQKVKWFRIPGERGWYIEPVEKMEQS